MNFQHLKHFLTVAEELHFGRAAERLGMAQPPLSQSIRRLEESLGSALFLRTRRRVELTPVGLTLVPHAREILNECAFAQKAVQRAKAGGVTQLSIGFSPNILSEAVPTAIRALHNLLPGVRISLVEGTGDDQVNRLLSGNLDLGFFHPAAPEFRRLEMKTVESTAVKVAIPEGWRLAERPHLTLKDLDNEPLLMFPQHHRPEIHASIMAAFRKAGARASIFQEATYDYTRLKLVAAGLGYSFINEMAAPRGYPGVVVRPIPELIQSTRVDTVLAWRRAVSTPLRKVFLAVYKATLKPGVE